MWVFNIIATRSVIRLLRNVIGRDTSKLPNKHGYCSVLWRCNTTHAFGNTETHGKTLLYSHVGFCDAPPYDPIQSRCLYTSREARIC